MRECVARAHAKQTRNDGRVPYAVHCLSVGSMLAEAIVSEGEFTGRSEQRLAENIYLAGLGHDLYEDTEVSAKQVVAEFGPTVDSLIEAMSNRDGDHDRSAYMAALSKAEESVRLIKLADLTDNAASVAYGLHDLGAQWASDFMLPVADEVSLALSQLSYARFPKTAAVLEEWCQFAVKRLRGNINFFMTI